MTRFNTKFLLLLLLAAFWLPVLVPAPAAAQVEVERILATDWSPDGALVAATGSRRSPDGDSTSGVVYVLDMPSGALRWQAETPGPFYSDPQFSPDGNRLAVARCQFVDIYAAATGELLHTHFADFADPPTCVREIDWRADGTRYLTAAGEDVIVWDADTYEPLHQLRRGEVWDAAFQPGGDLIAVGGSGGIALLPSTLDTGGQPFDTFIISPVYYVAALEWNATGTRLAFTTHSSQVIRYVPSQLGVYDLSQQAEILHMSLDTETAFGLDWSVDEEQVVTQSGDGRVRVWDLETGTLLAEYTSIPRLYPIDAAFSPYGGRLAYGTLIPSAPGQEANNSPAGGSSLAGGAVQIVVPDPSLGRLNAIAQLCARDSASRALGAPLTAQAVTDATLPTFVAQIESLPADAIPPACRADLLAVADAL